MKKLVALFFLLLAPAAFAQQALTGFAQAPSASPEIYHVFDQPDGTNLNGLTLESGNTTFAVAPGLGVASVIDHEFTNGPVGCSPAPACSNAYVDFANTPTVGGTPVPITDAGGTIRMMTATSGCPIALIADNATGAGSFINFLHLNVCQDQAVLTYCVTGSCPPGFTVLYVWPYPSLTAGALYRLSWHIDNTAHTVSLTLPDGRVTPPLGFPSIIMPVYNRIQLGGFSAPGAAHWASVWSGASKAEALAAAGGAAPVLDVTNIRRLHNEIGAQKTGLTLGSPTLFATFTTPGPQYDDRLIVSTETVVESAGLPGVAVDIEDWEVPVFSAACCNILGPYTTPTHSNPQNGSGVCFASSLSASISGTPGNPYTVALYLTPNVYGGCPNNGAITSARLNYDVQAKGDPGGVLTKQ